MIRRHNSSIGLVLAACFLAVDALALSAMRVSPPAIAEGGRLHVQWESPAGSTVGHWVGLFPAGGKGAPLLRIPAESARDATVVAPKSAGGYQLRYFDAQGKEVEALRSERVPVVRCRAKPRSAVRHVVILVQENHSFDSYFARYCIAPTGTTPTCNTGRACCEAGPDREPATGATWRELTEQEHGAFDPNHQRACMIQQMNGGKMDRYVTAPPPCGDLRNFAYVVNDTLRTFWDWADQYAMGDRVFQSVAGASSSNDMYLAQARFLFTDNERVPKSIGGQCLKGEPVLYEQAMIGDVLAACNVSWSAYAEGYRQMREAAPKCLAGWPHTYDPSDVPFSYYRTSADNPATMKDLTQLYSELANGTLPTVSFVKPLGVRTAHPGSGITMKDEQDYLRDVFSRLQSSRYAKDTLVLLTPDESGGYFDHVAPPAESAVDGQPYGPRIYLLALGHFARRGYISHVPMEHSSILRFLEWNWLDDTPGQLGGRDAVVNGIGSLLDPARTGVEVP